MLANLRHAFVFYRHREPSVVASAMREAIPQSCDANRVHSITHDKGAAS